MQEMEKFKKQWNKNKASKMEHESLIHQRENDELERQKIRLALEEERVAMHRYLAYSPDKAANLQKTIEEKQNRLEILEQEIRSLEKKIEHFGEEPYSHEENREQMARHIFQQYPEAEAEYTRLKNQLSQKLALLENIAALKSNMEGVVKPLKEGMQTIKSPKKRGLLDFIFGRHPKVVIAQKIHAAHQEAEQVLRWLQLQESLPFHKEHVTFLTHLIDEAKKRWNKDLYSKTFFSLYEESERLSSQLDTLEKRTLQEVETSEAFIEAWMENY